MRGQQKKKRKMEVGTADRQATRGHRSWVICGRRFLFSDVNRLEFSRTLAILEYKTLVGMALMGDEHMSAGWFSCGAVVVIDGVLEEQEQTQKTRKMTLIQGTLLEKTMK